MIGIPLSSEKEEEPEDVEEQFYTTIYIQLTHKEDIL
jgi:hypothetical protein